ncbi:MAG: hypothetical protein ABI860_04565 [Gemmatimonadales bacterium]
MESTPDYSRAALARFVEFVVEKNLVHPSTAQGWRVATANVLEDLPEESTADVRRIDVETTFRAFLHRYPGRLAPSSVGEYRRRVGRAIEEFVRWMDDPGAYAFRGVPRPSRPDARRRRAAAEAGADGERGPPAHRVGGVVQRAGNAATHDEPGAEIALAYPLRPDLLARVVVPRNLTVEEARRMGAFLVTLAVDFRPSPPGDG